MLAKKGYLKAGLWPCASTSERKRRKEISFDILRICFGQCSWRSFDPARAMNGIACVCKKFRDPVLSHGCCRGPRLALFEAQVA